MKRTLALSALATVLSTGALAQAETITLTPTDDTFVKLDGSGPYGSSTVLNVKQASLVHLLDTSLGLIRFSHSSSAPVSDASLELTVSVFNDSAGVATSATFSVWGIVDGTGCGEAFNEDAALWDTISSDVTGFGDVDIQSSCIYDGNPGVSGNQKLGTFTINQSQIGQTISFTSEALVNFVGTNRNKRITFLISRNDDSDSLKTKFASKEATSLAPPTLHVEHVGVINLDNLPVGSTQNPDGSWHFEGDLPIPVGGGMTVTAPDAIVDMSFDANGELATISGTVGFPDLPATGLFNGLGPMSSSVPYVEIGYDYPTNFDTIGLPMDPGLRYFYFVEQSGASVEWGALSAETPDAGATMLALEAKSPSVYFYSDQLFGDSALQSLSVGVSGGNNIPFYPSYTTGVESQMSSFNGDVYLGGSMDIDTSIPGVAINVTGDTTVNVKDTNFLGGTGEDWIYDLGVNGDVSLVLGLDPFSLTYYLGGGTFRYANRSNDWIAFSGLIQPDEIDGLPFQPKGYAQVYGYVTQNFNGSFLDIEGEIQFGTAFVKQQIEAAVHLEYDNQSAWIGSMSGSARFAGTTVGIYGEIAPSYALFGGSISHKFSATMGGIGGTVECDIDASFDSRHTSVDMGGRLKFCWKDPLSGKHCDSAGGSVSVNSSGQIQVCASIFGDTKCDTLS